jgi:hypothetical protein
MTGSAGNLMNDHDTEFVRDVFWDLFRQGIVILGRNDMNQIWPSFRLSHNARETLAKMSPYRFHDANCYLKLVKAEAPDLSAVTEEYLAEAIATYYVDRLLSACVMLGIAAEVEFVKLIETAVANPSYAPIFQAVEKERQLRQKIVRFQAALPSLPKAVLLKAGEDLDMQINSIQSVLRVARNKAGHALAGRTPIREQVYVYLQNVRALRGPRLPPQECSPIERRVRPSADGVEKEQIPVTSMNSSGSACLGIVCAGWMAYRQGACGLPSAAFVRRSLGTHPPG